VGGIENVFKVGGQRQVCGHWEYTCCISICCEYWEVHSEEC